MAAPNLEEAVKQYPELRLYLNGRETCVYQHNNYRVEASHEEVRLYIRTYEYCKALVKIDRYEAAKEIAFSRNSHHKLPFDRLPFLALLTDVGHLIETVEMHPKLEIHPLVKGRRVSFFYDEGNRHERVKTGFVGHHLHSNTLCEEDVKQKNFDKAVVRSINTPLSSRLITTYDAHIQCKMLLENFDYHSAVAINKQYELRRDINKEFFDIAMPMALQFRQIYQQQSMVAAQRFARDNGFIPVIRNGKLVTLRKWEKNDPPNFRLDHQAMLADVPILHYVIADNDNSYQPYSDRTY